MQTIISILRGINVSGQKKIPMAGLKALYENLGFTNVATYIQSGNVVFNTQDKENGEALAQKIEAAITQQYGFDVPVITRNVAELKQVVANNPFLGKEGVAPDKLHVTFLSKIPEATALQNLQAVSYPPDEFVVTGKEVYLHCPVNYGDTKLSNKFLESKLKVTATTRNLKTVNALLAMAEKG